MKKKTSMKSNNAVDEVGTPSEMKMMLQGLGVKKVQKMADCLAENGIETRKDFAALDDDLRKELDEALKEGGISIGDRAKMKKAKSEVIEVTKSIGNAEVAVPQLVPGQAMQTASKLERVFLGMGWAGKACQSVDVDASCVAFAGGAVAETIFFQKLRNDTKSLVHTGDVLQGGDSDQKKDFEDLERIYVWLQKLPANIDCIVFVANIFTEGVNLENLESAYVRLCNADTNQELARIPLSGGGLKGNCLVFCKLYRTPPQKGAKGDAPWQILGLGMPTTVAGMTSVEQMIPMLQKTGTANPPQPIGPAPAPPAPPVKPKAKAGGKVAAKAVPAPPAKEEKVQKPRSVLPCVALGVATAGGIAAATAIYMNPDLTSDMMNSEVFTGGVDFGADALEWSGDALVGACDLIGDGAGEVYGWAGSVVSEVPGMETIGEGLGCVGDFAGEGLAFGLDGAGIAGDAVLGAGGDAVGFLGDQNWEGAGQAVLGAGGDAGQAVLSAGGDAVGFIGDGQNWENAGGAIAGAGGAAVGFIGDGENWENAGGAIAGAGGEVVNFVGDGENWANAGGAVAGFAEDAGGAIMEGGGAAAAFVGGGGFCSCCEQIMAMLGGSGVQGIVGDAVGVVGELAGSVLDKE